MTHLPPLALSVRQPWAWAIVPGGKDFENRDWRKPNPGLAFRGRVAIHASTGMTRDEYESAADFMRHSCGVVAPQPHLLVRGGIIGSVDVVDVVRYAGACTAEQRASPWFVGPVGLVLRDPAPGDWGYDTPTGKAVLELRDAGYAGGERPCPVCNRGAP